jgi:photosystem II stability/assembly factor-like uncharacterized protein
MAQIEDLSYATSSHEVVDIFILNPNAGWIVVRDQDNLCLFRTVDGGESWTQHSIPPGVFKLSFVNPTDGWALQAVHSEKRYFTKLLRTIDGGLRWTPTKSGMLEKDMLANQRVLAFTFPDTHTGLFLTVGSGGIASILITTDGGQSVKLLLGPPNSGRDYRSIFVLSDGRLQVAGMNNILSTNDGGKKWNQGFSSKGRKPDSIQTVLNSGWLFPDGSALVAGQTADKGVIFRSDESGANWHEVLRSRPSLYFDDLYFWSRSDGCAIGLSDAIFCTRDGGKIWFKKQVPPRANDKQSDVFTKFVMLSNGRGWILRAGGFLYQTTDSGETWHEFDLLAPSS